MPRRRKSPFVAWNKHWPSCNRLMPKATVSRSKLRLAMSSKPARSLLRFCHPIKNIMPKNYTFTVTDRGLAAILAGLRVFQQTNLFGVEQIATNDGEFDALKNDEVDALCLRLNTE
jgi:hypothetical protein